MGLKHILWSNHVILGCFYKFLSTCGSRDSYSSTFHHKHSAVPGVLESKFTMFEKAYIWSLLYDANIKLCIMVKANWGHNILLCKEPQNNKPLLIDNLPM